MGPRHDGVVERSTVAIYEGRGAAWAARRTPVRRPDARAFARTLGNGAIRLDLGCGAGRYTADLGTPVIGIDAARTMLDLCREAAPSALLVQGDIEALPFGPATFHGAWANMSYVHVRSTRLPLALADLHRVLAVGAPLDIQVLEGTYEGDALPCDDVGGRFFASWSSEELNDVLSGAGFDVRTIEVDHDVVRARAERARTLPDFVGPGMRLLVVGLNPSLYAADAGIGYARPGNRFWPCAMAAGLVTRDRDPFHALHVHGVGMTDVVKRGTTQARQVSVAEYNTGMRRIERLARWLVPGAICFVGLSGWRATMDRTAVPGVQSHGIGGRPVYVMPSTSGANARCSPAQLTAHLRAATRLAHEG